MPTSEKPLDDASSPSVQRQVRACQPQHNQGASGLLTKSGRPTPPTKVSLSTPLTGQPPYQHTVLAVNSPPHMQCTSLWQQYSALQVNISTAMLAMLSISSVERLLCNDCVVLDVSTVQHCLHHRAHGP
jgi:hypothetical protein